MSCVGSLKGKGKPIISFRDFLICKTSWKKKYTPSRSYTHSKLAFSNNIWIHLSDITGAESFDSQILPLRAKLKWCIEIRWRAVRRAHETHPVITQFDLPLSEEWNKCIVSQYAECEQKSMWSSISHIDQSVRLAIWENTMCLKVPEKHIGLQ